MEIKIDFFEKCAEICKPPQNMTRKEIHYHEDKIIDTMKNSGLNYQQFLTVISLTADKYYQLTKNEYE